MTEPYYQDDLITLYLGDCLEITHWLDADVLVTDPPYGVAYRSGNMNDGPAPVVMNIQNDQDANVRDAALELWGKKPALVFGSWRIQRPKGVTNRLIWHKAGNVPAMRTSAWFNADEEIYQIGTGFTGKPVQNVIVTHDKRDGAYGEVAKLGHPTPKPIDLMQHLISKCPPGVIADPFAGAGATLVAASHLGRQAIGVELEERHAETIAKRLSQSTFYFGGM